MDDTLKHVSEAAKAKGYPMLMIVNFGATKPFVAHACNGGGTPKLSSSGTYDTPAEAIDDLMKQIESH